MDGRGWDGRRLERLVGYGVEVALCFQPLLGAFFCGSFGFEAAWSFFGPEVEHVVGEVGVVAELASFVEEFVLDLGVAVDVDACGADPFFGSHDPFFSVHAGVAGRVAGRR